VELGVKTRSCAAVRSKQLSKAEYNSMIRSRDKHIWKIKDVVECRSRGSRDRSTGVRGCRVMAWGGMDDSVVKKSCDRSEESEAE
jgi:hypothetical protein